MGRRFRGFVVAQHADAVHTANGHRKGGGFIRSWSGMKEQHQRRKRAKKEGGDQPGPAAAAVIPLPREREDKPMARFINYVAGVMEGKAATTSGEDNVRCKGIKPLTEGEEPKPLRSKQKTPSKSSAKKKEKPSPTKKTEDAVDCENLTIMTEIKRMSSLWRKERHIQVIEAFKHFDIDSSNSINPNELRAVLAAMGYNPSEEQVNIMMAQVLSRIRLK